MVTAVRAGWELKASGLEKKSRKTTFCAFKSAPAFPVDPVSYSITTALKWVVVVGLYKESRKRWRPVVVPAWTFQSDGACAWSAVNTHACHCHFWRERLWQKAFFFFFMRSFKRNTCKTDEDFSEVQNIFRSAGLCCSCSAASLRKMNFFFRVICLVYKSVLT